MLGILSWATTCCLLWTVEDVRIRQPNKSTYNDMEYKKDWKANLKKIPMKFTWFTKFRKPLDLLCCSVQQTGETCKAWSHQEKYVTANVPSVWMSLPLLCSHIGFRSNPRPFFLPCSCTHKNSSIYNELNELNISSKKTCKTNCNQATRYCALRQKSGCCSSRKPAP